MKHTRLTFAAFVVLMVGLGSSDSLRGIFSPVFSSHFALSATQLGLIVTVSYIGNLVFLLVGGNVIERFEKKKALLALTGIWMAALAVFAFTDNYYLLLAGMFCAMGASTLLNTTLNLVTPLLFASSPAFFVNLLFFTQGIGTSGSQSLLGRYATDIGFWHKTNLVLLALGAAAVLLLAFIFFSFAFTDLVGGNGYLAVYLSGLVIGNHKLVQKRPLTVFFDGFTWLMQIVMFLTLGLFVNTRELLQPEVLILGSVVGTFLIFVARPLSVFACLLPFRRFTTRARFYISWVGLRGAVPILFAIYPMMDDVAHADLLFNVVFLSTIISLVVQGTTVSGMANLLGLAYEERESAFDVNMHEDMKSALTEVEVNESMLESGSTLKDIVLPENTLVMMVCRNGEYFVPRGKTELKLGDKLLVITDRSEELESTYREMGIDDVMKLG